MARLYHSARVTREGEDITIYPIDEGDYRIAITFPEEEGDDENDVTEVLLTEQEVRDAYDLLFNK